MRLIDANALFDKAFEVWGTEVDGGETNLFMEMINNAPTITQPPNAPLTLDELGKIYENEEGPVWVTHGVAVLPAILDRYDGELVAVWNALGIGTALRAKDYGVLWLAYRRKPEEETP